jgi:hypothetical protein
VAGDQVVVRIQFVHTEFYDLQLVGIAFKKNLVLSHGELLLWIL